MIISNLQVQMQNVSTGGIFRYTDSIRLIQNTDISRILIVIQNNIVIQTQGIISEIDDRRAPVSDRWWLILWLATRIYFWPHLVSTARRLP